MTAELFEQYKHKVKTRDELADEIGAFPREQKIIMCHGVFDVVHPGHVRHMAYAKSKADMLLVSVTCDKHIDKGMHRPHVPEDLRALNLAAFEMVDYVIIDENAKPLESIRALQPDYFAKGFEYTEGGLPPSTREELDVIEEYGGEVIFTPGDVVYSSSKLIDMALPDIKIDKLLLLMSQLSITFDDLRDVVMGLGKQRVHVVGDTIIDSYTRTTLIGGQTKTPTFSVLRQGQDNYIGGAGIVSQHLRAAGAEVIFTTVLGDDSLKDFAVEGLEESGVDCRAIVDNTRPTTNKNAFIADGYRLLKVDTLDNRAVSEHILDEIVGNIQNVECDAIVFSDFRHGIFNRHSVPILTNSIPKNVYKVADSQVASRWGNITEFKGFDLITPNEREARFALADQESTVVALATTVAKESECGAVMLKLGNRGVFVYSEKKSDMDESCFSIDSFSQNVLDAVGAGDAMLAYATLSMLKTGNKLIASILGSMAAACECEHDGNVPISPEDVIAKISMVEKISKFQ